MTQASEQSIKYSINLLWLNKTLQTNQEYILPTSGCGRNTTAVSCLAEAVSWKQANPEASVTLWYDSVYTPAKAIEKTQSELNSLSKDAVQLKDIREIPIVKSNPDIFSSYLPIYFRVDLLKYIICLYSIENEQKDCAIFTDFLIGYADFSNKKQQDKKLGKAALFSPEITSDLNKYGLKVGREGIDGKMENQFFQMMANPKVLTAFKVVINICLNMAVTGLKLDNSYRTTGVEIENSCYRLASLSDFIYSVIFTPTSLLLCLKDLELFIEDIYHHGYDQFGNTIYGNRLGTVNFNKNGPSINPLVKKNLHASRNEYNLEELFSRPLNTTKVGNAHNGYYTDLIACPPANGIDYQCHFVPLKKANNVEELGAAEQIAILETTSNLEPSPVINIPSPALPPIQVLKPVVYEKKLQPSRPQTEYQRTVEKLYKLTQDYRLGMNKTENSKPIIRVLDNLLNILNKEIDAKQKIIDFYKYLDAIDLGNNIKNSDIIKKDPRRSTSHFLIGIALIAVTLVTGILPGLLIMALIYGTTGRHVGELFQSHKIKLQENLNRLKSEFEKEESLLSTSSSNCTPPPPSLSCT